LASDFTAFVLVEIVTVEPEMLADISASDDVGVQLKALAALRIVQVEKAH
jgi:hypothetical protein